VSGQPQQYDAVIVGAGFSGLYQLLRLRRLGMRAIVLEKGSGVGGTWYWNRYPGARCDVVSMHYSYSFDEDLQQEWEWTERYSAQPEILKYLEHVADRFDLRRDISFDTKVTAARFDEATARWTVTTQDGDSYEARFCIMATGMLSDPNDPDFKGLESFEGEWYQTGRWPHEGVDFTGKRVAVIGTGSTGIQTITTIADQVDELVVFQRTPNYSVPAHNRPLDPDEIAHMKAHYGEARQEMKLSPSGIPTDPNPVNALDVSEEERSAEYERRWGVGGFGVLSSFADVAVKVEANETLAGFIREKIHTIVKDPATAELLTPKDHPVGTKRPCVDTGYFDVFNRDHVELVDIRTSPIQEITPTGIRTFDREFELDVIVFAIGFDAMTGALNAIDIRGRDDVALRDVWAEGPRTYLGLQTAGFPNMFFVTGPGSPSVLSNMVVSIEQHVDWITDCIGWMGDHGHDLIEASTEAQEAWVTHVNEVAATTLMPSAASWYMGANIPGKPRIFMPYIGGVGFYRTVCDTVAEHDYEGFHLGVDGATTRESAGMSSFDPMQMLVASMAEGMARSRPGLANIAQAGSGVAA
jgi:cyclohexanone monooxygenase